MLSAMRCSLIVPCLLIPLAVGALAQEPSSEPPLPLGANTLPPLSLSDAAYLLDRGQRILEQPGVQDMPEELRLARLMLQCVIDYVQLTDQRRSSLTEYTFSWLGKETIRSTDLITLTFTLEEPLPNVQALALDCTRDPVMVSAVDIETASGRTITRRPSLLLDPAMPGRSFLYLPEIVQVSAVTVTVQTESEDRPRLKIWLGQAPHPEFLRQALAHLFEARGALDAPDLDLAAAEMELARRLVAQAEERERQ